MADRSSDIIDELMRLGITQHDALVIADCIITRKSCSWMNTDPVDDKMLSELKDLIHKNDYKIAVSVDIIATRNKYIWDVKVL
ncbi:MAG: hypothetical protein AB1295_00465 [Candidatus Micrarchaeota archaeon]